MEVMVVYASRVKSLTASSGRTGGSNVQSISGTEAAALEINILLLLLLPHPVLTCLGHNLYSVAIDHRRGPHPWHVHRVLVENFEFQAWGRFHWKLEMENGVKWGKKRVKSHFGMGGGAGGVKWRLLELPSQNGLRNSSTGIRGHVHNTTGPECKHWVGHPTHAERSPCNTCLDHTHRAALMLGADLGSTNIQTVTSFTS